MQPTSYIDLTKREHKWIALGLCDIIDSSDGGGGACEPVLGLAEHEWGCGVVDVLAKLAYF